MPDLLVDFPALERLMITIEHSIDAAETALDDLDGQVRWISQVWQGAAASGFQRTVSEWEHACTDLHERLMDLHELVATAYANHAGAVATNTNMWKV